MTSDQPTSDHPQSDLQLKVTDWIPVQPQQDEAMRWLWNALAARLAKASIARRNPALPEIRQRSRQIVKRLATNADSVRCGIPSALPQVIKGRQATPRRQRMRMHVDQPRLEAIFGVECGK